MVTMSAGPAEAAEDRIDPHTGARTYVVGSRQVRPNRPSLAGCPFCPGGLEAPEDYDVRWFVNRWPALPDDRCEVVLYTPEHDASFWSLGAERARRVIDVWAERTAALGVRPNVDYVLIFENRGAEVGATIPHPHGQIYAFDRVPEQPRKELERGELFCDPADRLVAESQGWKAWVPDGPVFPYALRLMPSSNVADLPSLNSQGRDSLAALLVNCLERLDRAFDAATPYMLWIHQRPFDGNPWPQARLHLDIVSPWRKAGLPRYVAAGELGSGVYFNPVPPEAAAQHLRDAVPTR